MLFWSNLNGFAVETLPFLLHFQHSEEMYDPEIYRHQISEYYNPYVLDAEIQTGEFNSNSDGFERHLFFHVVIETVKKKNPNS